MITFLVYVLVLIAASTKLVFAAQSVLQLVLGASEYAVRIFAGKNTGTGFAVVQYDKNTFITTNNHVIEDDGSVK